MQSGIELEGLEDVLILDWPSFGDSMSERDSGAAAGKAKQENDEIGKRLKKALQPIQSDIAELKSALKPKPGGFHRAAHWLKEWGILSGVLTGVLALVIALVGMVITLGNFAASEVRTNSEFRGKTSARLDSIEASLRSIRAAQSPRKVLEEIGTLDQKAFAANLPALQRVTEQPVAAVQATPALLTSIAARLRNTPDGTSEYWPTVLRFLHFASASGEAASKAPPPGATAVTVRNVDITPGTFSPESLEGRVLMLDGGSMRDVTLRRDRIVFTTNPVLMHNVTFIDCVFEFPTLNAPNPLLQRAAKQILHSDFSSVSISDL